MRRLFLLTLMAGALQAQIRIDSLNALAAKAKESVDISLDSTMLQLASKFLSSDKSGDKKFQSAAAGLKNISVRSFEFDKEGQYRMEDVAQIQNQLRGPGWSKIIDVNSKGGGEITQVYTKTEQGKMVGVAIIAAEPKELTVVAIEGDIDLASLANLSGHLGIPDIPYLQKKGKQ